jgi:hypothetical protein
VRPLTLWEVAEAALIDTPSETFPAEEVIEGISEEFVQSELLDMCGSFLEIRGDPFDFFPRKLERRIIHLQHFTMEWFLLS